MFSIKVLGKVWDRFNTKPSTPTIKTNAKIQKIRRPGDAVQPGKHKPGPKAEDVPGRLWILSPDIRLSDDHNLVRRKWRGTLGLPVATCKTGAMAWPSLDSDELAKAFSSDKSYSRKSSSADCWQADCATSITKMEERFYGSQDPFEAEEGFEDNLEDRILNMTPIGSSTPRQRPKNDLASGSSVNSAGGKDSWEDQLNIARRTVSPGNDKARLGPARKVEMKPSCVVRASQVKEPLRGPRTKIRNRVSYTKGLSRVKKHPSPSKRDLEELELALQRNETVLRPVLAAKDRNRFQKGPWIDTGEIDPLALPSALPRGQMRGRRARG